MSKIEPHLITPLDWCQEAQQRAAKLTGTREGELALVEAHRYMAFHEIMAMTKDEVEKMRKERDDLKADMEANDRELVQTKAQVRDMGFEIETLRAQLDIFQRGQS